jgi:hypothetical protein
MLVFEEYNGERLIPLRPGPQNVVVAGHVRDRTNHEHDGYG